MGVIALGYFVERRSETVVFLCSVRSSHCFVPVYIHYIKHKAKHSMSSPTLVPIGQSVTSEKKEILLPVICMGTYSSKRAEQWFLNDLEEVCQITGKM